MTEIKPLTIENDENYLRQVSENVKFPDNNLKEDIKSLEDYFKNNDTTIALAAIQIGIPKRIIYLKNTNLEVINRKNRNEETEEDKQYNEARVLINPKVLSREGLTEYWEACASCLDNTGKVKRPYKITLEYYDINQDKHIEIFEGFESTVLSHELDHLDGILHIDIAEELLIMTKEERKVFRQTHDYVIISKTGIYENLISKKENQYEL